MAEEGVPADVDPLLNAPDVPAAFCADGEDSEAVSRLKAIITTAVGPELEAAIQVRRRRSPARLHSSSVSALATRLGPLSRESSLVSSLCRGAGLVRRSGAKKGVGTVSTDRSRACLAQEGCKLLQTTDGRAELIKLMEGGRADPEIDAQSFENVVKLLSAALKEIMDQDDCDNALLYMDAVGIFTCGPKKVSQHPHIKSSPLWKDMQFWQETIFEVVSKECSRDATPRGGDESSDAWSEADEEQRQLKIMQEQNVAFGQIQTVAMHMLDTGNEPDTVVAFVKKLQALELLTSPEHIMMLSMMMTEKAGKPIDLTGDGSAGGGMNTASDPMAEAQAEAARVAHAKADAASAAFRAAETGAIEALSEQLTPLLLPGAADDGSEDEKIVANSGRVGARLMDGTVYSGVLFVTSYRLAFVSKELPGVVVELPVVTLLDTNKREPEIIDGLQLETVLKMAPGPWGNGVELPVTVLKVVSKDVRELSFIFDDNVVQLLEAAAAGNEEDTQAYSSLVQEAAAKLKTEKANAITGLSSLSKLAVSTGMQEEAAQTPTEARAAGFREMIENVVANAIPRETDAPDGEYRAFRRKATPYDEEGQGIYDARAEFERQGAYKEDSGWKETDLNQNFELCSTYPKVLMFPAGLSPDDITGVSKFRSKQRLPSLSWIHPENKAAIVRCAQPLVGLTGKKSEADEKLFTEIQKANGGTLGGSNGVSMLDARPWANAVANKGRKGGYEKLDNYEDSDATLVFLNIDNIHVMRNSLYHLHALIRSNQKGGPVDRAEVNESGWPAYVGRVLGGGATIVREIEEKGRTCVVHCSDGWDRTAQLAAVPALCMEPYYRTYDGFRVLCQREWNSFGHKFRDRTYGFEKRHERSPIFLQFLDCVQCIMYKYPEAFEFNEWLLLQIIDALYSMSYSDYRCNHERGTLAERENRTPAMVWSLLFGDREKEFRNCAYNAEKHTTGEGRVLTPPVEARTWVAYFNRWTADPINGQPPDMLGVADGSLTALGADRPKRTFEELVMSAAKAPMPAKFVELPFRHRGTLWRMSGKMKKDKEHYCILHDFVEGEASLVYYELEKSESTVPVGIIPLHEGAFNVDMMPTRTADPTNDTGRTYFQVRWKTEGDAAAREAAKAEMDGLMEVLALVTEDSQDKSPDQFTQKLKNEAATASSQLSDLLAAWFARRLKSDAVATRIKTLQLLEGMVAEGNGAFRTALKDKAMASIEGCKTFSPPADPEHGDKPAKLVQGLAGKVSLKISEATVAEQVAGAPEVKTVFSCTAAELPAWLDALKVAAGQENVPDANEILEVDLLDVANESLKLIGDSTAALFTESVKLTKRFSGKATAPILASAEGSDVGVHYQLKDQELSVKAKKTEIVKWDLEGGWRVRWKLVCGSHNIGYKAYFVAKAPLKPEQSPDEVDAAFAELEPMLMACTADGEHRAPADQTQTLKEIASGASIEVANRVTYWLAKRLGAEESVPIKLKTINLMTTMMEVGNADYKLATKRNCVADLQAAQAFEVAPHETQGGKPRDMVRGKAKVLVETLVAAPDEAQEVLMAPATIPAEGTVCSGFEVAKAGQLVMVFDNTVRLHSSSSLASVKLVSCRFAPRCDGCVPARTRTGPQLSLVALVCVCAQYSKMRAKRVNFNLALEPDASGMMLTMSKMADGYMVTKIGGSLPPAAAPVAASSLDMRGSVAAALLDEEALEGMIESKVEELIEDDEADRAEVIDVLVQFTALAAPSHHLKVTVESLKDARLGSGPAVEKELQDAIEAAAAGASTFEPSPAPAPASTPAEESDEDDSL